MEDKYKVIRQSIIEWYSFKKDHKVLLINCGDSSLDELLEDRCTLSINDDYSRLGSVGSGFDIVIMYDLYDFCIESNVKVKDMMDKLLSLKTSEGTLFVAMENKLGMKYFAGCQEEQKGGFYIGIEDYSAWDSSIHPMSKKELEDMLGELDVRSYRFYYPYPDYKYPTIIYTDDCLPKEGELYRNIRNIDRDRYVIFDEKRAFDSVIKAGLFPEFSNSYLISIN